MYDTIIIGAGPAGLTSALYLGRANKKVLVLESKSYGGQIINASRIENYPGISRITGFDFATTLYEQVKNLGVEIKYETVLKVEENKKVTTNRGEYEAITIILAPGTQNRKLGFEEEEKLLGKGVSYCATCDGNFYRGKVVAVVGGGNTAFEDALYLSDLASHVYVIHRREEFRGEEKKLEELHQKENIQFFLNTKVVAIHGEEKLTSITLEKEEETIKLPLDGLFVAIGQDPQNEIFKNVVDLNEKGYIQTTKEVLTKTKGIYAVGDAREKDLRQLTTAVGDGSLAATYALQEISGFVK